MSVPTSGQEPPPERAPRAAGSPDASQEGAPQEGAPQEGAPQEGGPQQEGSPAPGMPPPGGHHLTPPPRRKWPWIVLVVCVLVVAGIAALATFAHHESSQPVAVSYKVTGSARTVDVAYSTWDNQVITTNQVKGVGLPWQKNLSTTGFAHGGALTVTLGASGGTATCSVVVHDKTYTATASGPFAAAQCRGF